MPDDLLPVDDVLIDDEADLELAAASAIEEPALVEVPDEPPIPYGMSWEFDFNDTQEFVLRGTGPAETRELASLNVWIRTAIRTARGVFDAVAEDAGMVDPEDLIGSVYPVERIADYERRLGDALILHDRIAEVGDFESTYDPSTGDLTVNFNVLTDDDETLDFNERLGPFPRD